MKGRRLEGPAKDEMDVRPTSDRAREALFSILQSWPKGAFVDLFGGTGAVALEAHSRGFAPVSCVEAHPRPFLLKNLERGGVSLVRKDAEKLGPTAFRDLSVVFADPPYDKSAGLWTRMASTLRPWLAHGGVLAWETDDRTELVQPEGWRLVDTRAYGMARFHFFEGDKGLEGNYLHILRGAPGEPGKAADHGISGRRHGRLTQTGDARRPRPKGWPPSTRSAASRPLCNEPRCPAGPSLRSIAAGGQQNGR